ncbi:mannosyltransferase putative-domain-containing protein [Zopfochytrium polystomum]|nr:mannosyltransferase putative-domain-containing protein [Zopfochytrium polystomum]
MGLGAIVFGDDAKELTRTARLTSRPGLAPPRKFNITARDFTSAIADNDWGPEEFRLGGPKVDSILASPFEQVLFLDPDNYVLRDPTYLFDTKVFKKYGAIFWPDFPVRKNDSELIVWDVMGLKGKYWKELEFESGQVVLDKSRTWRALMLAKYISQQAKYYFTQFLGDKEAFFWGFAGTNTPYFLTPTYIHSVGAIVDDEHPGGSNDVYLNDPNTKYCGQSMMQSDFYDDPDNPVPDSFVPEPLFMHWNMLKYKYVEGVDYFQSAMTYEVPKGTKFADYKSVGFRVHGDWGYFSHCLDLRHVKGLNIRVWPWSEKNPNKAEAFHRAWRISHDAVASARYDAFIKSISGQTYKATQAHVARGSRGVVFVTSRKNIPSIIMAALLLRKTGCKLPIVYMYNRGDTTEIEIEILRKYNVSTADYRDEIRGHTWSPEDWAKGASVASAILTAPFEEMIFLEPESYLLSDPTSLLDSNEFQAHGALFWAGPGKRRRDDHLRDVLKVPKGVNEGESDEVEFKAGIMVVSKAKAWKALKYVEHILFNADYFFKHLDGYRDAFYYGFLAAQQTYFLNPTAPTLIGVMTQHNATTPETFCGQAILQYNLASSASGGAPKPLVLDMRFAKSKYDPVVDHLMVASIVDGGKRGVDTKNVGTIGKYSDCLIWDAASSGVAALISDWQSLYPKVNTVLHEVRSQLPGEHEVQKLKRQKLLGALSGSSPFQPTPTPARSRWSIWPPSKKKKKEPTKKKVSPLGLTNVPEAVEVEHERGLVMPASATNLANVVRTMLLLRESGWKLPITITYYGSDLGEMQIVGLKTFRVDVVELTPRIQPDSEWTSHELNMAVRIESIIAAPYAQVLMLDLDTDIYPLQDPTYLFNAKPFRDTGALFWPDVRARNQSSALWAAFEMTKKWEGMVLDAGHFLVDKRKVWNALMMARHLVSEGKFYTSVSKSGSPWTASMDIHDFSSSDPSFSTQPPHARPAF